MKDIGPVSGLFWYVVLWPLATPAGGVVSRVAVDKYLWHY
jgi:hypothetical protein